MKPLLRFFVKMFLSLLVNFINSTTVVSVMLMFSFYLWSFDFVISIIFFGLIGLTILSLFFIHKYKPLENKSHIMIYWSFSILCIISHICVFLFYSILSLYVLLSLPLIWLIVVSYVIIRNKLFKTDK